ncbi:MAG: galactose mutarotase [Puniceicoccales bacterium]|jgi:aldose 1-epimerase|nr:galactose mutarotase [Puniceicoccales bacterium]
MLIMGSTYNTITCTPFGTLPNGRKASLFTLDNRNGVRARISDFGASIVGLDTPDKNGHLADIALGYDTLEGYLKGSSYFGAVVGRVANRIAQARFTLEGHTYMLPANNTPGGIPCTLHGGNIGIDKMLWNAQVAPDDIRLTLTLESPDGQEGFPGNLLIQVVYTLRADNTLCVDYTAITDKATPVNLSQHCYFNLAGEGSATILDHQLRIAATHYTPVNSGLIPTGEICKVAGTPFDFTAPHAIGERVEHAHEQLTHGAGYDHNWVLDGGTSLSPRTVAEVHAPASGRIMSIATTEPGIQFYCGNFLDGALGKGGKPYAHRSGFALETQHFPDSPNQPAFPPITLLPGQRYASTTHFAFSARAT